MSMCESSTQGKRGEILVGAIAALLLFPLTDAVTGCANETISVTCTRRSSQLIWSYNSQQIGNTILNDVTGDTSVTNGVEFVISADVDGNMITSNLSFFATIEQNGSNIRCQGIDSRSSFDIIVNYPVSESPFINAVREVENVIETTWIPSANANGYSITCANDECMPHYFPGNYNKGNLTLPQNVTNVRLVVMAENACNSVSTNNIILIVRNDYTDTTTIPTSVSDDCKSCEASLNRSEQAIIALSVILGFTLIVCVTLFIVLMVKVGLSGRSK